MKLYPVNQMIENRRDFHGKRVYVEGLLAFDEKNVFINHCPKSDQAFHGIWIETGAGVCCLNPEALKKLAGKKVVCLGEFQADNKPDHVDGHWGFGPDALWPARIIATELVYYKTWYDAKGV